MPWDFFLFFFLAVTVGKWWGILLAIKPDYLHGVRTIHAKLLSDYDAYSKIQVPLAVRALALHVICYSAAADFRSKASN